MDRARAREWLNSIWPHLSHEELLGDDYGKLTRFITGQLAMSTSQGIGSESELILLVQELGKLDTTGFTRKTAFAAAHRVLPSAPQLVHARTLDLALQVMLTMDIQVRPLSGGLRHTLAHPGPIVWDEDNTCLSETVTRHFSALPLPPSDLKTRRIDPGTTMAYLCTHRGFTVSWTSNLGDHLAINWKSRVITVYEHKICLRNHLSSPGAPIIPREILQEAIDTLNLLFPLNDSPTKAFLKQSGRSFYGLGYCKRERYYELAKYRIWRERMADLVDVMNEEPKGVQQLALSKDGRNALSFATFWIACAVALLTAISIAFGTVQTLYSIKQYNLAVAQTCSAPGASTALPQYCS